MIAPDWEDRTVRGPHREFLDRTELRKLFGLSDEVFDELLKVGIVPQPMRPSKRTVLFSWRHAVLLNLWMELGGHLNGGAESTAT